MFDFVRDVPSRRRRLDEPGWSRTPVATHAVGRYRLALWTTDAFAFIAVDVLVALG
jgi:hypothetical protein